MMFPMNENVQSKERRHYHIKNMRDLASLRENWKEAEKWETRLLQEMSVVNSVEELEALYREFKSTLEETEYLFRDERLLHLQELQQRLSALKNI